MKLRNTLSILFTSLLLCGNAFAKPDSAPPEVDVNVINTPDVNVVNTPDVNVVNTPDVNVVNTILLDDLQSNAIGLGAFPGSFSAQSLSQGYLHGFSLNVAAEPGDRCHVLGSIEVSDDGTTNIFRLGRLVAIGGSTSFAHDFTTPIVVLFDSDTGSALLKLSITGSATSLCWASFTAIFEPL